MLTPLWAVVGVLIFAGASFFFAVAESALFSLGQWQTRQLAQRSAQVGALVVRLLAEPQDLLATIVLGNTFANAAIVAIPLWLALSGGWSTGATLPLHAGRRSPAAADRASARAMGLWRARAGSGVEASFGGHRVCLTPLLVPRRMRRDPQFPR